MTPFTQTFGLSLCAIAATPGGRLLCRDTIAATHTRPHRQQRHAVASVVEPAFRQISGYLRVTPVSRGGHGVVFPSGRPLQALGAGPTEQQYRRSWYQFQRFLAQNRPSTTDSAGASAAAGADPGSNRSARASASPFAETVPPRRCLSGKATPRTRSDRAHIERLNRNPTQGPVMATMNVTWHANIANQTAVDGRRGDGGMRRGGEGGACHPLTGISCSF
jgi:hypothetical protein